MLWPTIGFFYQEMNDMNSECQQQIPTDILSNHLPIVKFLAITLIDPPSVGIHVHPLDFVFVLLVADVRLTTFVQWQWPYDCPPFDLWPWPYHGNPAGSPDRPIYAEKHCNCQLRPLSSSHLLRFPKISLCYFWYNRELRIEIEKSVWNWFEKKNRIFHTCNWHILDFIQFIKFLQRNWHIIVARWFFILNL